MPAEPRKIITASIMATLAIGVGLIVSHIHFLVEHAKFMEAMALLATLVSLHIAILYGYYAYKWGFFSYVHSKRSEDFLVSDEIVSLNRLLRTASAICARATGQLYETSNNDDDPVISDHDTLMFTSHMYCVRDSLVRIKATSKRALRPLMLADYIIHEMQTTRPHVGNVHSIRYRILLIQDLVKEFQATSR